MHKLIGQMLRQHKIGFVELNGKVPVKSRGELIKKFEKTPECKIFLSTEAGGAGLNLQMADILINFELPWNPAKKNQRIGRIDRLGQKSSKLTIYNLITLNSIEQQIAAGLIVKQSLFEGVLDSGSQINYVDFSTKGRSQFIEQLEAFINRMETQAPAKEDTAVDENEAALEQEEIFQSEDFEEERIEESQTETKEISEAQKTTTSETESKVAEMEQVMNSGMQFLAGLFKMSTGKDLGLDAQQIKVNKETGEVTMTFKLPV
jgi:superfamily II DNA/RNA helicase